MNSKDSRYWIRDYTDNELDTALDQARYHLIRVAEIRKARPDDKNLAYQWYHRKQWFLALVDETASRWKLYDDSQRKMFRQQ